MHSTTSVLLLALSTLVSASTGTYKSQPGQTGYNDCGTEGSQTSECQTLVVNSLDDFCLWAPPTPGPTIGDSEEYEVAWCTNDGHGTRIMPAGTIHSAHYVQTPHYTQITGTGDFTKINIKAGDEGGELDPHGATGLGNPIGALVYANGVLIQEWTSFISDTQYCIRICPESSDAWLYCQLQGCEWNEPGDYGGGFDSCQGDSVAYPGVYPDGHGGFSTYQQGDGSTPAPPAHPAGATSNCRSAGTVGAGGPAAPVQTVSTTTTTQGAVATSTTGAAVTSSSSAAPVVSSSTTVQYSTTTVASYSSSTTTVVSTATSSSSSAGFSTSSTSSSSSSSQSSSTTTSSTTSTRSLSAAAVVSTTAAAGAVKSGSASKNGARAITLLGGMAGAFWVWA